MVGVDVIVPSLNAFLKVCQVASASCNFVHPLNVFAEPDSLRAAISLLSVSCQCSIRAAASTLDKKSSRVTAGSDPVHFGISAVKDMSVNGGGSYLYPISYL
jgi:hypothetical protein